MQRTHIYLPDQLNAEIELTAKSTRMSKAEIVRKALYAGLPTLRDSQSASTKNLLKIVQDAKKFRGTGPQDLSTNHDYYTWGGEKKSHKK